MGMYNDYYLLKRIEEEEGSVAFATSLDSFTYKGEVVKTPRELTLETVPSGDKRPRIGDKVLFLKGAGEDVSDDLKVVKFEDIIMLI